MMNKPLVKVVPCKPIVQPVDVTFHFQTGEDWELFRAYVLGNYETIPHAVLGRSMSSADSEKQHRLRMMLVKFCDAAKGAGE